MNLKTKKTAEPKPNGESLKKAPDRNQELEIQLKRALADYQNLERRVEEERKLLGQLSSAILIEKFLPVLDNLENAQSHLKDQGLEMVIRQFRDVLISEQVEEINADGAQFDPNLHEATEVVEGQNDGKIVKVTKKGYKIKINTSEKVLRPAQVIVERHKISESADEKAQANV